MKILILAITLNVVLFITGCNSANVISEEEMKTQNAASEAVAAILFDNELDNLASYNVRNNGEVVIRFHDSVKEETYTDIVAKLRSSADIKSVYAEQNGNEVCKILRRK